MYATFYQYFGSSVPDDKLRDCILVYLKYVQDYCSENGRSDVFPVFGREVCGVAAGGISLEGDSGVGESVTSADNNSALLDALVINDQERVRTERGTSVLRESTQRSSDHEEFVELSGGGDISSPGLSSSFTAVAHDGGSTGLESALGEKVSEKTLRNRAARVARKERKQRRKAYEAQRISGPAPAFQLCDESTRKKLAESRAKRLIAENEQAHSRAVRELELSKLADLESEARRRRAAVSAKTERDLVSIEKNHATLVATGNVPTEIGGFAATINSGSISPDSSASLAELRTCQKDLLDFQDKVRRLTAALEAAGVEVPCGARTAREEDRANGIWTDNTENMNYLEDNYSGFAIQRDYCGTGKMRVDLC